MLPSILNNWGRITDRKEERWRCISTQRMRLLPGKALNVKNDKCSVKEWGGQGRGVGKMFCLILKLFPIIPPVRVKSQHIIKLYLNIWRTTDGKENGFSVRIVFFSLNVLTTKASYDSTADLWLVIATIIFLLSFILVFPLLLLSGLRFYSVSVSFGLVLPVSVCLCSWSLVN